MFSDGKPAVSAGHVLAATRRALAGVATLAVFGLGVGGCAEDEQAVGDQAVGDETAPGDDGDGDIEDGTRLTAFDTDHEAVANLDPELLDAVQQASEAAGRDGVELQINSGWRSPELQQRLLDDAIETYGSVKEARRWVTTPEKSKHVTGEAVDIGSWDAAAWLDEHGNAWGLCRIYDNEPWHFELAAEPGQECPRLLFDASEG